VSSLARTLPVVPAICTNRGFLKVLGG
jgi:hypothetical protein